VAPHIARRAFLYGDVESPTSEELKPLDAAVEGLEPTPAKSPPDSAYSPLSDMATLYIDDEDWRGYSEPVRMPLPGRGIASSSFRARRSIGKTPKSVRFDPRALFLSAAADGELDVLKATAAKVYRLRKFYLESVIMRIAVYHFDVWNGVVHIIGAYVRKWTHFPPPWAD